MEREEQVLWRLSAGTITFSEAAEHLDTTVWDVAELVNEADATWVSGDHLEADLRNL